MLFNQCVDVVYFIIANESVKSRHGVGCLRSHFPRFQKSSSFFRGSFSRALTFPRPTSLLRIYSNSSHLAQIPDNPLDCNTILRQAKTTQTTTPPKAHATLTHNPPQ
jgi:hypothetical protein